MEKKSLLINSVFDFWLSSCLTIVGNKSKLLANAVSCFKPVMAEIEQIPKAITTPCGSPVRLAAAITKELTIPINMPITGKNLEAFGMDGFDKTKPIL